MECEKWAVAIAAYRALAGLSVSDAGAHYDLARALLASGNKIEAEREILRSLEIAQLSQGSGVAAEAERRRECELTIYD